MVKKNNELPNKPVAMKNNNQFPDKPLEEFNKPLAMKNNNQLPDKPLEEFNELIAANNAYVNVKSSKGITHLHLALHKDKHEMAKVLIAAGADVNATAYEGVTPLHIAVNHNNIELIKVLIKEKADVNAIGRAYTPLSISEKKGYDEASKLLKEAGADEGLHFIQNLRDEFIIVLDNGAAKNQSPPAEYAKDLNLLGKVHTEGEKKEKRPKDNSQQETLPKNKRRML